MEKGKENKMDGIIKKLTLAAFLTASVGLMGCLGDSNPASTGGSDPIDEEEFANLDLASENGGYTESDEQPYFGDDSILKTEGEEVEPDREGETLPDREGLESDPAYNVYFLRIVWGQLEENPELQTPTDWSGSISVDRGAVVVQRLIRFENDTDYIERPRDDRTSVSFSSWTLPSSDGLLLRVYDPNSGDDVGSGPNTITFDTGPLTQTYEISQIDGLAEVIDVDDLGNQVSFRGARRAEIGCENGYLAGFWRMNPEHDRGVFGGVWVGSEGRPRGFVRGHFGVNDEGNRVLFAKYISRSGEFKGVLRGTYEPNADGSGSFSGVWMGRGGRAEGRFSGRYAATADTGLAGVFEGAWSTNCGDVETDG